MIDIFVVRDGTEGLKVADAIVEPLLADVQAAVERGRNVLDDNDDLEPITLEINYRPGLVRGQVVEVLDSQQGKAWRGKITGITHRIDPPTVLSQLRLVRRAP